MEYTITTSEKKRQRNLFYQLWRLAALSLRFIKLTRLGCIGKVDHNPPQTARH